MKQYLLLRNNQESGPYSLEELIGQQLRPLDLIWKEGQSTAWQYAKELSELEGFVNEDIKPMEERSDSKVFVSLPAHSTRNYSESKQNTNEDYVLNDDSSMDFLQPMEALKERDNGLVSKKPVWEKRIFQMNDALRLAAVFAGLVFGAFIIKKAADSSIGESDPDTETSVASIIMESPGSSHLYQNALVTEVVTPVIEEKPIPKSVKPKDIRRQIKIRTNDYKNGVFGGVTDLQLTALNASPHFIDKIVVTVDYIKKNGEVVDSKKITFRSIEPNSSKKLDVPQNRRGVKVKTSVNTIYSKEYKAALKQA